MSFMTHQTNILKRTLNLKRVMKMASKIKIQTEMMMKSFSLEAMPPNKVRINRKDNFQNPP